MHVRTISIRLYSTTKSTAAAISPAASPQARPAKAMTRKIRTTTAIFAARKPGKGPDQPVDHQRQPDPDDQAAEERGRDMRRGRRGRRRAPTTQTRGGDQPDRGPGRPEPGGEEGERHGMEGAAVRRPPPATRFWTPTERSSRSRSMSRRVASSMALVFMRSVIDAEDHVAGKVKSAPASARQSTSRKVGERHRRPQRAAVGEVDQPAARRWPPPGRSRWRSPQAV